MQSRETVTRGDSGGRQFNISEVLGSGITAGIGLTYRPAEHRTPGNVLSVWASQIGWDTMALGLKEFWPDIHRRFSKKRTLARPATVPTPNPNGMQRKH